MNTIDKKLRQVKYGSEKVDMMDYFVDGQSLEAFLRSQYPILFQRGRYSEFLVPGSLTDEDFSSTDALENRKGFLPPVGEKSISTIYICHDGCCKYIFAEIEQLDDEVIWHRIGQNLRYIGKGASDDDQVVWLPEFKPLHFSKESYLSMLES